MTDDERRERYAAAMAKRDGHGEAGAMSDVHSVTVYLRFDGGATLEIGSTEFHRETQDTAIPSLLRALADEYVAAVASDDMEEVPE